MRVDIQPQWRKLANWYWTSSNGLSIWEMLEHEYGARKSFKDGTSQRDGYLVIFPDEKSYTAFLLRWA